MLAPPAEESRLLPDPSWAYILPGRAGWYEAVLAWIEQADVPAHPLTYRSCEDLVKDLREGIGCVLADTRQPDARGAEIVWRLRKQATQPSVLLISSTPTIEEAVATVKAGASSYLEDPLVFERFQQAYATAMREAHVRVRHRAKLLKLQQRFETVSPRERQVLELLARGLSSKTIATELEVSKRTVDYHRGQLMAKVGVESSVQLVSLYGEKRLLEAIPPLFPYDPSSEGDD